LALLVSCGLAQSAFGDQTPFATATTDCSNSTVTFPVQSSEHENVLFSVTSSGATGSVASYSFQNFYPGDQVWGEAPPVDAETAPTLTVDCTGGSAQVSLYDVPNLPASFSGVASNESTSSTIEFNTLGAGQYVMDVTLNQGSLSVINQDGYNQPQTIASSGQYSLGSLPAGLNSVAVQGMSGPPASYTIRFSELPVAISQLTFGQTTYANTGTILTGTFSVSGDTTVTAYIRNAAGQTVRHLGTYSVPEGDSSITWDARGDGGVTLPDGTYYLQLNSSDPNGNVTSAQTPVLIDNTPPTGRMVSPGAVGRSQAVTFSDTDKESGVASLSLFIDGRDVDDFGYYSGTVPATFSYMPYGDWTLGRHTWEIRTTDNAGNSSTFSGKFTVANVAVTSSTATKVFGSWIRRRYGSGVRSYWTCPRQQMFDQRAICTAEFKAKGRWHLVTATVAKSGDGLKVTNPYVKSWIRRWSRYSRHVIAGFQSPGRAQVNSPAYDWAFAAAGAYYEHEHHRRSFKTSAYDGNSAGLDRLFTFNCHVHRAVIRCTNSFGDSMKYRP
jgi:hypothetical protein